ncbi:hypothetical protein V1511DRAFT_530872 [Dipodascopsis uninucleata]
MYRLFSGTGSTIPFSVSEFSFSELRGRSGIQVLVVAAAKNPYPIHISLPALEWVVEAPACDPKNLVELAVAHTDPLLVQPNASVKLKVVSKISDLPEPFIHSCPGSGSESSAMDQYMRKYLAGDKITLYVHGRPAQVIPDFPPWVADILAAVSIPVPVPGRKSGGDNDGTGGILKSYGLSRVKITMPSRGPGENPGAWPRISALVHAVISLPPELDFNIDVNKLRGLSDMIYEGDKFGVLNIDEWIPSTSYYTPEGYIQVVAEIADMPLEITDQVVFKKIVQKMFFMGEVNVDVDGTIDVQLGTPVGYFAIRNIPAKGTVALRGFPAITELAGMKHINDLWYNFMELYHGSKGYVSGHYEISVSRDRSGSIIETSQSSRAQSLGRYSSFRNFLNSDEDRVSIYVPLLSLYIVDVGKGLRLGNLLLQNVVLTFSSNSDNFFIDISKSGWTSVVFDRGCYENNGKKMLMDMFMNENTGIAIIGHDASVPSQPEVSNVIDGMIFTLPNSIK